MHLLFANAGVTRTSAPPGSAPSRPSTGCSASISGARSTACGASCPPTRRHPVATTAVPPTAMSGLTVVPGNAASTSITASRSPVFYQELVARPSAYRSSARAMWRPGSRGRIATGRRPPERGRHRLRRAHGRRVDRGRDRGAEGDRDGPRARTSPPATRTPRRDPTSASGSLEPRQRGRAAASRLEVPNVEGSRTRPSTTSSPSPDGEPGVRSASPGHDRVISEPLAFGATKSALASAGTTWAPSRGRPSRGACGKLDRSVRSRVELFLLVAAAAGRRPLGDGRWTPICCA